MDARWLSYKEQAERAIQQNKLEHAESLWYAALQDAEGFPANDPRLTITLECLAELLFKQRKYAQAEPLCARTLQIYEETIGPEHPDVGILANNLAMLYHMQDKFEQAEVLYKKALTVQTKALGSKHPEVINLLGNYANLLFRVHRDAEGEQLRAMAKSATTGKWNMSGRYQAYNAGGVAPAQTSAGAQASAHAQAQAPTPAQAQAPMSAQALQRQTQQQQAETMPTLGKILASLTPPPIQKPIMPATPQIPLPPPSTEAPPTPSGIGKLMQQRKDAQKT